MQKVAAGRCATHPEPQQISVQSTQPTHMDDCLPSISFHDAKSCTARVVFLCQGWVARAVLSLLLDPRDQSQAQFTHLCPAARAFLLPEAVE